jgi:hypothetical protein
VVLAEVPPVVPVVVVILAVWLDALSIVFDTTPCSLIL